MGNANSTGEAKPLPPLPNDQEIKIYRKLKEEYAYLTANGITDDAVMFGRLKQRHTEMEALYRTETFVCPKVRFGRTELQMPILTCGGMRQQETWAPKAGFSLEDVNKEVQLNFEACIKRSMELGINHFETARGYGSSELQYGPILKKYPRSSYILQTKVLPMESQADFRKTVEESFTKLGLDGDDDYLDLFGFHGINQPFVLDQVMRPGGCLEVIREYQAKGKIRHVGFSTHGRTSTVIEAIETGVFDYVNLHYHFIGSYTSSGSGPSGTGGNLCAIEAAKKHDMGVFIISPTDKGGALYEPPRKLYKACLPLTPIAFNNLWLWAHPEDTTPIHTLVIGCARPADFDEHLESAMLYPQRRELVAPIQEKLHAMVKDAFGPDFMTTWYKGLPDPYENDEGVYVCYLYWLWWICKAWGMHKYAQNRYGPQQDALKRWDDSKTPDENRSAWNWVFGVAVRPEREAQLRKAVQDAGHPDPDHVVAALKEVHHWLRDGGCIKRGEAPGGGVDLDDWRSAYDLQPQLPYCERPH